MRLLVLAVLLLAPLPATAAVTVNSATVAEGGICVELRSTGAASVTVLVDGRPDLSFVKLHWSADGTESLTAPPRRGEVARSMDHGRDAQNRLHKTVWIPTKASEPLAFRVQVHEGATKVADHAAADLPTATDCAAAP